MRNDFCNGCKKEKEQEPVERFLNTTIAILYKLYLYLLSKSIHACCSVSVNVAYVYMYTSTRHLKHVRVFCLQRLCVWKYFVASINGTLEIFKTFYHLQKRTLDLIKDLKNSHTRFMRFDLEVFRCLWRFEDNVQEISGLLCLSSNFFTPRALHCKAI